MEQHVFFAWQSLTHGNRNHTHQIRGKWPRYASTRGDKVADPIGLHRVVQYRGLGGWSYCVHGQVWTAFFSPDTSPVALTCGWRGESRGRHLSCWLLIFLSHSPPRGDSSTLCSRRNLKPWDADARDPVVHPLASHLAVRCRNLRDGSRLPR